MIWATHSSCPSLFWMILKTGANPKSLSQISYPLASLRLILSPFLQSFSSRAETSLIIYGLCHVLIASLSSHLHSPIYQLKFSHSACNISLQITFLLSTLSSHLIWKRSKPKYLYAKSNYLCSHYCIRQAKYCKTLNKYLYRALSLCKLLHCLEIWLRLTLFICFHVFNLGWQLHPSLFNSPMPGSLSGATSLHISQKKIEALYLPTIDSIIILHQMEST